MTQPTTLGGRLQAPAPGVPTPELRIVRVRSHARRLFWCVLLLLAVAGTAGYFYNNLPEPFENWMLLSAAAAVIFLFALLPFLAWWSHTYTVTTRRVIERSGVFGRRYRELSHVRGYSITLRRGILQRMWRTGSLHLSNGVDDSIVIRNIPRVDLVHEALVDQVEVNQILAHRDAQPGPGTEPVSTYDPPPLP